MFVNQAIGAAVGQLIPETKGEKTASANELRTNILVLVGESGSGKSSIADEFVNRHPEYRKAVECTTRPPRNGERQGTDYCFVSEKMFSHMISLNDLIEYTEFNGWYYGMPKGAFDDETPEHEPVRNYIMVTNPSGLRQLKAIRGTKDSGLPEHCNICSVHIDVGRRARLVKMLARGDDIEEAYRRNLHDEGQFSGVRNEVDHIIENDEYKLSVAQMVDRLEQIAEAPDWKG